MGASPSTKLEKGAIDKGMKIQAILFSQKILLAGVCLTLSACVGHDIRELKNAAPTGDAFLAALSSGYLRMSEEQANNYDWVAASVFAQKGLQAAYGTAPGPEEVNDWKVPEAAFAALKKAQGELEQALANDATEQLARAQLQFDCWVDATEDTGRDDLVESCKQGYEAAMGRKDEYQEADAAANAHTTQSFYLVPFAWNDQGMNAVAKKVLAKVVEEIRSLPEGETYQLVLNGHTDRSGGEQYNYGLSQQRAMMVKQYLLRAGIGMNRIEIFAFGETDPKKPTADGVREAINRRVELFIQ